jgi:hypothetical protein
MVTSFGYTKPSLGGDNRTANKTLAGNDQAVWRRSDRFPTTTIIELREGPVLAHRAFSVWAMVRLLRLVLAMRDARCRIAAHVSAYRGVVLLTRS